MPTAKTQKRTLSEGQREELLKTLQARFEKNKDATRASSGRKFNPGSEANPDKLWSLSQMERTGGEPDVVGFDKKTGEYVFFDCSAESPRAAEVSATTASAGSRKEHKPQTRYGHGPVMGIELLRKNNIASCRSWGDFDLKTSSWVKTPAEIRNSAARSFAIAATTRLRVSQRRGILLCRSRVPWLAQGVTSQRCSRCGGCLATTLKGVVLSPSPESGGCLHWSRPSCGETAAAVCRGRGVANH